MKRNVVLCVMSIAAASSASSTEVGRWYVTPQAGGLITDDDRHIEDGDALLGLNIGKHANER